MIAPPNLRRARSMLGIVAFGLLVSGVIMCALIPLLAGICIPLRGIPAVWFWIDSAFAPAAALPLWIALRDIRRAERVFPYPSSRTGSTAGCTPTRPPGCL